MLFSKSGQAFENQNQYEIVKSISIGKDGYKRKVQIESQNENENAKRLTVRDVMDLKIKPRVA